MTAPAVAPGAAPPPAAGAPGHAAAPEAGSASADALAEAVRAVRAVTRATAESADLDAAFPADALAAMREQRLLGLLVPREYGGFGGGMAELVAVSGQLAREDLSAALIFAMHCQQVAVLAGHAGRRLRAELLPRVARGEVYLASVTTERAKGGRLLTSDAPLRREAGGLAIDRDAPVVTGVTHADGFLVTARAAEDSSPNQVSLIYADRSQVSVDVTGDWQPMGMRASESLPARIAGVVPGDQVVGAAGGFRDLAVRLFAPAAHLGWSACWLGAACGALSRTVARMRGPEGRRSHDLGSDLLLSRLGRIRGRLDLVHALLQRCVAAVEQPGADLTTPQLQLLLNALKTEAAEQCYAAVDDLIELVGLRHGYMRDSPLRLESVFRDLRAAALNYSNDRLHIASGRLALLDTEVRLA